MDFGDRIRQLRRNQGYTLRELASLVGINFTYLSKIETGSGQPPSEETIRSLANALETDADELILLAKKLPRDFERDLLSKPESHVADLYRSMRGKEYSEEEWREILKQIREKGKVVDD